MRRAPHIVTAVSLLPADRKDAIASSIRRGVSAARIERTRAALEELVPKLGRLGIGVEMIVTEIEKSNTVT